MGKVRTRILGLEEIEKKQKEKQKEKAQEKKKIRAPGLKGGERMVEVEVKEKELEKLEKAKKILTTEREKKDEEKQEIKIKKVKIRGKKYQQLKKLIDPKKEYSIKESVSFLKKMDQFNFIQAVEIHLNVDKVGLRGEVDLPFSIGKKLRVAIVNDEVIKKIEEGKIDFDVLISHPSYMPRLARFAKVLGPKSLMPNPKAGTISTTPELVAKKFEKGMIRWKTESKFPLIHQLIGKLSMKEEELEKNIVAFLKSVGLNHIRSAFVKATMTPALKLDLKNIKA